MVSMEKAAGLFKKQAGCSVYKTSRFIANGLFSTKKPALSKPIKKARTRRTFFIGGSDEARTRDLCRDRAAF